MKSIMQTFHIRNKNNSNHDIRIWPNNLMFSNDLRNYLFVPAGFPMWEKEQLQTMTISIHPSGKLES